jgi:F0F1-type ATP synthase assembly protein I
MDKNKSDLFKTLGVVSSMGISFVLAIFIGVLIGRQLDKWLGTGPWFFFIFLLFGIIAGFRNLYIITNRVIKKDENSKDK